MLMSLVAYISQLERLVFATKAGCIKPYKPDIIRAIAKMQRTEASYTVIHLSVSILYILVAARVVAPEWFVMAIIITFETASTTITFFWFVVQKYLRKRNRNDKEYQTSSKREWGEKTLVGSLTVMVDNGSLCEIDPASSSPRSSRGSKDIPTALG